MAKGDDALNRKKNKVLRKRLRNSDSSVSARVAALISAKRRRKAGRRRICEGMCYSLPTEDDPFNERHEKKSLEKNKESKKRKPDRKVNRLKDSDIDLLTDKKLQKVSHNVSNVDKLLKEPNEKSEVKCRVGSFEDVSVCSKFLVLCLKAIADAWVEEGTFDKGMVGNLLSSSWGGDFCKVCSTGSNVVVIGEAFAVRDQVAWLVSTAADIVTRKEKQGLVVSSPFLLFLVPSGDRAIEVRSLCKPLKTLGVHTISLHPKTSLDHQIFGLKNCEPEFLVSTPERLLELVSLNAIDISGTSLLVLDGLTKFDDLGLLDSLKSIRESISGDLQIITFSKSYGEVSINMLLQHLLRGSIYRLSAQESVASLSTFISQYIHFCKSEEKKFSEVLQILAGALGNKTVQNSSVLLISENTCKTVALVSCLNTEGYAIGCDSHMFGLRRTEGGKSGTILVKDFHNIHNLDIYTFEIVILVDFPSNIEDYISMFTKIARHTLAKVLHSFFSKENTHLAQPLISLLEQYGQDVPEFLRSFCSSNSTS